MEKRQKGWASEEATAGAMPEAGRAGLMATPAGFTDGLVVDVREQEGPTCSGTYCWFAIVLFLPILFCVIMAKHITKFTILTTVLFTGIECIHIVVQPSHPSISKIFSHLPILL